MSTYIDPIITDQEIQEEDGINLKQLLYKYLSYWKWILTSFLFCVLLGVLYIYIKAPIYEVRSALLIKDNSSSGGNDFMSQLNLFSSSKKTDNEIEILKTYNLMEKVVKDLNLTSRYYTKEGLKKIELYNESPIVVTILEEDKDLFEENPFKIKILDKNKIKIGKKTYAANTPILDYSGSFKVQINDSILATWEKDKCITVYLSSLQGTVKGFQENIEISTPSKGKSTVLFLALQVEIPQMGIDVLSKLIEKYDEANIADKNLVASKTQAFVDERVKLLSKELSEAEKEVESYKSSNAITSLGEEGRIYLETIARKDAQLSSINIQLGSLKNIEQYISRSNNDISAAPATLGIEDPTLLQMIAQLTSLEAEKTRRLQTVPTGNPLVVAIDEQIENLKRSIFANIQTIKKGIETTKQSILSESVQLENMIKSMPQKERQLIDITRQRNIKNELYIYLLSKREEVSLSHASTISDSRVIDYPIPSNKPVKPKKRVVLLIFGMLGLVLPVAGIYLKDIFQNKIESKTDITKITSIPILGEISFAENKQSPILISKERNNKQAEQLRTLRTNLQFMGDLSSNTPIKTILFTSNTSGEGKTLISLNLGASLALTGKKTVILGLDMRRPLLQVELDLHNTSGLSLYLSGQETDLKKITYPIAGFDNYFVIPGGPIPPNPIELLLNEKTNALFEQLNEMYDYIVIDSPPVGLVSDSLILSKYASIVLYVVRQKYTEKESITNINNLYKEGRFKKIGIINNGIKDDAVYYGYRMSSNYYEAIEK